MTILCKSGIPVLKNGRIKTIIFFRNEKEKPVERIKIYVGRRLAYDGDPNKVDVLLKSGQKVRIKVIE